MNKNLRDNPFHVLATMFPDERFDEIGKLFDNELNEQRETPDQWRLTGLNVLLHCLRKHSDHPNFSGTNLEIPLLSTLQALEAAYWLGFDRGREDANPAPAPAAADALSPPAPC